MTGVGVRRWALAGTILASAGLARGHEPTPARVTTLTRHLQSQPDDAEARVELAAHLRRTGRAHRAVREATRVLSGRAGHCGALVERALARADLGQRTEAYADLAACISGARASAAARAVRARLFEQDGRLREAQAEYSTVVDAAPTPDLVLSLARTSEALGEPDVAARALERGLARLGDAISLRLAWVDLEERRGRFVRAAALLDPLLDGSSPASAGLRIRRARLLLSGGAHARAEADLRMALAEVDARLRERPSASLHATRAEALLLLGRREDAASAARAALGLAPGLETARAVLAKARKAP